MVTGNGNIRVQGQNGELQIFTILDQYYYYYYYYDSIYLWMPYKKQAKPGATNVTQGP